MVMTMTTTQSQTNPTLAHSIQSDMGFQRYVQCGTALHGHRVMLDLSKELALNPPRPHNGGSLLGFFREGAVDTTPGAALKSSTRLAAIL